MATMSPVIVRRLRGLRRELRQRNLTTMIITEPVDVSYLSGFSGDDSWLLAGEGRPWLITDFRYIEQAEKECPGVGIIVRQGGMAEAMTGLVRRKRLTTLGFDPEAMSVTTRSRLQRRLSLHLKAVVGAVAVLRTRKDASEVAAIEKAVAVAEEGWREFRKRVRPGMTERRLAAELDYQMMLAGADGPAFPTICAIDASSSMPHAQPGERRLGRRGVLLTDFGAKVGGYVSDLTRVLFAGNIAPRVAEVYGVILEAQGSGIAAMAPGAPLVEVDAAARRIITAAGHGRDYQHGTGHGLGRQVHEAPNLGPRAGKGQLEPGMVVTVEPGIYLRGRFGIRIEDDVLVTETGSRVLSHLDKDLEAMVL
jgi:Xaa-Pro aminopeptidase